MDKDTDAGVRESSKVIKSNIFYIPEYRETILTQFLSYDGVKMSRLVYLTLGFSIIIFNDHYEPLYSKYLYTFD